MLDKLSSIVLIVACCWFIFWQAKDRISAGTARVDSLQSLESSMVGRNAAINFVSNNKHKQYLIYLSSPDCHYCKDSNPHIRDMFNKLSAENPTVGKLVAVNLNVEALKDYCAQGQFSNAECVQMPLDPNLTKATPTLLLTDSNLIVRKSWVGLVTSRRAEEILTAASK